MNTLKILTIRFPYRSVVLTSLLFGYIVFTLFLFAQWIAPSLDGRLDIHIAADSGTYIYFAQSLRSGNVDPFVVSALSSFPNTLWAPVLIAFALNSTWTTVLINYLMFFISLVLLRKSRYFAVGPFLCLLLLNATTTISLLSVNKEIVDLLAISLFLFARHRRNTALLGLALLIALINRFEICFVMILFLALSSKFNPWAHRRLLTVTALTFLLSIALPLLAARALSSRFEEASSGGVVTILDAMEMRYLYFVAAIPKIAENFFGELVNSSSWQSAAATSDIANSYILLSNNFSAAIVFMVLVIRRRLSLRSDVMFLAAIGCVVMGISLVIQPRYFYFAYILFCIEAAAKNTPQNIALSRSGKHKHLTLSAHNHTILSNG